MTGNDLLTANAAEARTVLDGVLADRIRLEPDIDAHRYRLTLPIAFERSDPGGTGVQRLQEMGTSPTGGLPEWTREIPGEVPAVGVGKAA